MLPPASHLLDLFIWPHVAVGEAGKYRCVLEMVELQCAWLKGLINGRMAIIIDQESANYRAFLVAQR